MLTVLANEPLPFSDLASRTGIFILGLFVVVITMVSLLRTVIVPRPLRSSLSGFVMWVVWWTTRGISALRRTYRGRDQVLAWTGPVMILMMLLTWLIGFLFGYAMLIYGVSGMDFSQAIRQSGSSLLTLGFAGGTTEDQTIIDFVAATTGPVIIAMLIGYLPTIFQTYLEREVLVTTISTIGGEPTWGPEFLARTALAGTADESSRHFSEWAEWAARLRLTHMTYPTLMYVRGSRANRHYVVALLAMLDAAALKVSLTKSDARHDAYRLLLQGSQAFETLYLVLGAPKKGRHRIPIVGNYIAPKNPMPRIHSHLPAWNDNLRAVHAASAADSSFAISRVHALQLGLDRQRSSTLTRDQFDKAVAMMREAGMQIDRDMDEAWAMFRDIRKEYEFPAYGMARKLDVAPAPWSGPRWRRTEIIYPASAVEMRSRLSD
ncbi:MAG: hypothetical protein Q8L05_05950 [Actinomycetota bacterium]|nr:hypothetical protein [Actinomycetota bacterium]MDP2287486.1 hypothetical protein [Actinomycetota bacterium]